jgi:diaminohydroxyphosphoribosylaminopyrimidine deaminase/5-amino-6-(5-phosphoribosylamino)uracil reductase
MARSADELFMKQALELAQQGIGLASPNPCVGALVVDERGRIVGRGVHKYAERKHAEVIAIEAAGALARGNTLYLNLEPCCHTGRTGPCTEAIIAAGVGRVVAAMRDPNPQVAGKGFAQLRAAGIEVAEGILEAEARKLNEAFARYIRTGLPFVTLKAAMTLDGKIAGGPVEVARGQGPSTTYITGAAALKQVHRLRHAADAIMVGIGTVLADNPLLTDRSGLARRLPLRRVILDSNLRLPLGSRVVSSAASSYYELPHVSPTAGRDVGHPGKPSVGDPGAATPCGDVLVFCCRGDAEKKRELEARGVRVEIVPPAASPAQPGAAGHTSLDLHCVLKRLGAMKITSLLVEGGATVNWACLQAGVVDKVWLFYAPRILGGNRSVPLVSGEGFGAVASTPASANAALAGDPGDAPRLRDLSLHRYGEDFAVEGYLRDPYA